MLVTRYVVKWKKDGEVSALQLGDDMFFTLWGAKKRSSELNHIGRLLGSKTVAVVWDRKFDEQVSTGLYV